MIKRRRSRDTLTVDKRAVKTFVVLDDEIGTIENNFGMTS